MTRHINKMPLTFKPEDWQALAARGFNVPGLAKTGSLRGGSSIEGPVSLIASVPQGSFLEVGAFCNISAGTLGNVSVGRYGSIADGVTIGAHAHPTDWLTTSRTAYNPRLRGWHRLMLGKDADAFVSRSPRFFQSSPQTTIGADVWIGQGVFVKSGVNIGHGAVVGARSVVTRDVPPYAIVAGTPARVLRMRFDETLVERLLSFAWWRYSIYDLFEAPLDTPDSALDVLEDLEARGAIRPYRGPGLEDVLRQLGDAKSLAGPA